MSEVRKRFFVNGQVSAGTQEHGWYWREAMNLLDYVRQQKGIAGIGILRNSFTTRDGARLTAISSLGFDEVWIDVPQSFPTSTVTTAEDKRERLELVNFSLWFFQNTTTIVEYDPVAERLTGKQFTVDLSPELSSVYFGSYDGGALLYAHDALWFRLGDRLAKVDIRTGAQTNFDGAGTHFVLGNNSFTPTMFATPAGILTVNEQSIVSFTKDGAVAASLTADGTDAGISSRLVGNDLYWYCVNNNSELDTLRVVAVDQASGALTLTSQTTDIYARLNTEYGGTFGAFLCNLAYDRGSDRLHVKPYWNEPDSGGSAREFASRGVTTDFASGSWTAVWNDDFNPAFDGTVNSQPYREMVSYDVIVPVASARKYLVLTSAGIENSVAQMQTRARVYDADGNGELATSVNTAIRHFGASSRYNRNAVWDGKGKVWYIRPSDVSPPYPTSLVKVDLDSAAITDMGVSALGTMYHGGKIAVQPRLLTTDGLPPEPPTTEIDWVLRLQEASMR